MRVPDNMVFTQGRGFVFGASFGLLNRSLRCRVLVCGGRPWTAVPSASEIIEKHNRQADS